MYARKLMNADRACGAIAPLFICFAKLKET